MNIEAGQQHLKGQLFHTRPGCSKAQISWYPTGYVKNSWRRYLLQLILTKFSRLIVWFWTNQHRMEKIQLTRRDVADINQNLFIFNPVDRSTKSCFRTKYRQPWNSDLNNVSHCYTSHLLLWTSQKVRKYFQIWYLIMHVHKYMYMTVHVPWQVNWKVAMLL